MDDPNIELMLSSQGANTHNLMQMKSNHQQQQHENTFNSFLQSSYDEDEPSGSMLNDTAQMDYNQLMMYQ